jgi:Flp pilus assembly protein TadG
MLRPKSKGGSAMMARLASCRSGVVSVEAALLFPVLIALVMGVMEFGLLIFTYSAMQSATREASRQVAVNFATPDEVPEVIAQRMPGWTRGATEIDVAESNPGDPENNVITVTVTMPAGEATPVPFFTAMADAWDLRTEVVMKQELPL